VVKPEPTPPAPVLFRPPAPVLEPLPVPEAEPVTPGPNLLVAAARAWPLVLIGVIGGVILGLLYHMQRPPVYQSRAELLVIKNRVELTTPTGAADSRVAYLEDYVATQFRLIQSTEILRLAANRLKDPKPAGFLTDERGQVAYLTTRMSVIREREPGSNALSNTLSLTFRASDPVDSKRCLQAIIEAYEFELGTVYERASGKRLKTLDDDISRLTNDRSKAETSRLENERSMNKISQERLESIRARITNLRNQELDLTLKKRQVERDLTLIKDTGQGRQERLAVMDRLGVKVERPLVGAGLDSRNPEDILFSLELDRVDRGRRLGADHPDMTALNQRIKMLSDLIAKQGLGVTGGRPNDELDRHRLKLENELASMTDQIKELGDQIELNDAKAERMAKHQLEVDRLLVDARQLDEKIAEKQRERSQVAATVRSGGYEVQAITPPTEGTQVAPVLYQSLLLGGILGLLLGGGLALGVEMSDRSFRNATEIRRRLGVPVLGHIPRIRSQTPPVRTSTTGLDPLLACFLRPNSPESEAVRGIRTQLYFSTQGRGHQIIQVTSPTPGDGKSTLAANLAISIAQSGKRVVLLDCDFRKPRVHRLFNLPNPEVGLASVMAGDAKLEAAVRGCEVENLFVMPCGPRPANPAELLTSPKFQELLAELRGHYDFVVIDSPPVLAVSDPVAVASRADGVLMVFRMTKRTRPAAERTREQLAGVGARILGVVVNASADRSAGYSGYGYTYQYEYQYTEAYAEEPLALPKKG
jgi:capsular exopolysaccharide synthesis family protein